MLLAHEPKELPTFATQQLAGAVAYWRLQHVQHLYQVNPLVPFSWVARRENDYKISYGGDACDPSMTYKVGQYVRGDSAQIEFYIWFDTIYAATDES
jgi:hypothetical protein